MAKLHSDAPIRFRRALNIGAEAAELDDVFLRECFVNTGDLDALRNIQEPKCIVQGRTGSGKTALLKALEEKKQNVIEINPESLALGYISNSNILGFFEAAGVNLTIFYLLLWRHILTVELLKKKFDIHSEKTQGDFLRYIFDLLSKNKHKERALKYLEQWGDRFWEETEDRIKETTTKLETELQASAGIKAEIISLGAQGAQRLSSEEKKEVVSRATTVVDKIQIRELHEVIRLLDEDVFNDKKEKYFIIIDRLDEEWVEDPVRYKMIKALIESVKSFRNVRNLKIIVSIRTDLYQRVIKHTASAGFQEEKYEALYLRLRWSRTSLVELINKRVNYLFRYQYTKSDVYASDILPKNQMEKGLAIDYILNRTFYRPREAIQFVNEAIRESEEQTRISKNGLMAAETTYSRKRLHSLADEWRATYPNLIHYWSFLTRSKAFFRVGPFDSAIYQDVAIRLMEKCPDDVLATLAEDCYINGKFPCRIFVERLYQALYLTGILWVKIESHASRQWSFINDPFLEDGFVEENTSIAIHKAFWSALGIRMISEKEH